MTSGDDQAIDEERFESEELEELRSLIRPTAERLAAKGHRLFFVGGIVRDLFLAAHGATDVDFSDVDLTTDARPKAIKAALKPSADAMWTQGERFGTIGAMVADHAFEITTHRAESYDEASRKPIVRFGDDLDVDLSRRDFTINSMAIEVTTGRLWDPYGGVADLTARRLRTPLDPAISFTDDPLRILRAARFLPRFGLDAAPELIESATELRQRLAIVSGERIHDELEKLLALPDPRAGLDFLHDTGLLGVLGLASADPRIDSVALMSTARARRAGLLLALSDDEIEEFLTSLRYSNADRRATKRVVAGVRRLARAGDLADAALVPFLRELAARNGDETLDDMLELAPLEGVASEFMARVGRVLTELRSREDLDDHTCPLEGAQVMELLQIPSGPAVGAAMKYLEQLRVARGPLSAEEAVAALLAWRGPGPTAE